jgi:saccharopine dehydrogenase-like NADP-dependent oxidoreductase
VVINALPYHMAVTVATAARDTGTHYFDLTEDVHATRAIAALAPMPGSLHAAVRAGAGLHRHRRASPGSRF